MAEIIYEIRIVNADNDVAKYIQAMLDRVAKEVRGNGVIKTTKPKAMKLYADVKSMEVDGVNIWWACFPISVSQTLVIGCGFDG